MTDKEIERKICSVPLWYHSIDLHGHVTPGMVTPEQHKARTDRIGINFEGLSVLDIGAWDGYYSFFAEQRGARRVLAIDSYTFREGGPQGGVKKYKDQSIKGFEVAKEILGSKVEYRIMDVYDLDKLDETFDVVFLFEMHHHFTDPILALDLICRKCKVLLVEGDMIFSDYAFMVADFRADDRTKAWRMSFGLMVELLEMRGFSSIIEVARRQTSIFSLGPVAKGSDLLLTFATGMVFLRCWR